MTAPSGPVRLFVCVDPSTGAADDLERVVRELEVTRANTPGHSTRITPRERWHVTLAFLGDVPGARVPDVARALDAAAHDVAGRGPGPVTLRFAGGGTFGRGAHAILWAGLDGEVAALRALAAAIRHRLRAARLPYDRRGLRPHLTISRPGTRVDPAAIGADVRTLEPYVGPEWTVTEVYLMRSQLGPDPVYTRLHRASLRPSAPGTAGRVAEG